jgi:hypothetical protein
VLLAHDALERELRAAVTSFERNGKSRTRDNSQRLVEAATFRQVAEIDLKQGNIAQAIKHCRNAVKIASDLLRLEPTSAAYAEEKARSLAQQAESLAFGKQINESLATFAAALDVCEDASSRLGYDSWTVDIPCNAWIRITTALTKSAPLDPNATEQVRRLSDRVTILRIGAATTRWLGGWPAHPPIQAKQ